MAPRTEIEPGAETQRVCERQVGIALHRDVHIAYVGRLSRFEEREQLARGVDLAREVHREIHRPEVARVARIAAYAEDVDARAHGQIVACRDLREHLVDRYAVLGKGRQLAVVVEQQCAEGNVAVDVDLYSSQYGDVEITLVRGECGVELRAECRALDEVGDRALCAGADIHCGECENE